LPRSPISVCLIGCAGGAHDLAQNETPLTDAQRKLVIECAHGHIFRLLERREEAAIKVQIQRGWLRDRVMAKLR
jgi:hypothetical protein